MTTLDIERPDPDDVENPEPGPEPKPLQSVTGCLCANCRRAMAAAKAIDDHPNAAVRFRMG